jgi:hypothetical protein
MKEVQSTGYAFSSHLFYFCDFCGSFFALLDPDPADQNLYESMQIRIHNTAFYECLLFRKLELEMQKDPRPGVHTGHAGSTGGNIVVANQVRLVRNHG